MKLSIQAGSTSQTVNVFVRDSSSTTGAGLTGLVFNSAGLTAYYALPRAAAVSITLATLVAVTSAYSSGGFKEIDATNMPGWYRFDIPDAALASGRFVSLHLKGATNMASLPVEIELTATNNQSATSFITAVNGIAQTGDNFARLGAPAGASISADIAAVKVDTAAVKAQTDKLAFTVANQIDANVIDWKGSAAPAMTGDAFARLGAPAGASIAADVAAVKSDTGTLLTGTISELAQAQPPTNPTLVQAVMLPYMALRNGLTTSATSKKVQNDAGTVICKKALSDDGTTYTEAKAVTGP